MYDTSPHGKPNVVLGRTIKKHLMAGAGVSEAYVESG